jgi:hypothetical protein
MQSFYFDAWRDKLIEVEYAKKILEEERQLRKLVIEELTTGAADQEGVVYTSASPQEKVRIDFKLNRKVDEALLATYQDSFREHGIPTDALFLYSPRLDLKMYRKLTPEQQREVDQALIITSALPTLRLVEDT